MVDCLIWTCLYRVLGRCIVSVLFLWAWVDPFDALVDTYHTVAVGHGAFELCLPSLGILFTKLTLRSQYWANVGHMAKVGALETACGSATLWGADLTGISYTASSRRCTMRLWLWCRVLCSLWASYPYVSCQAVVRHGNDAEWPEICFPNWVYHSLPYFSHRRHNPLVI